MTTGTVPAVYALQVFDDGLGAGPKLYVAGNFFTAGGMNGAKGLAAWNGTSWSHVGGGTNGGIVAFAVWDDGRGPALYVTGNFSLAGTVPAERIARWDGVNWSPLGTGLNSQAYALQTIDDASLGGPALVVGGSFTNAGGVVANRVARWNGESWFALGSGTNGFVRSLSVFDDGDGPALVVGGDFTTAGGGSRMRIAKWNGASWAGMDGGMNKNVRALLATDAFGPVPRLFAAGDFFTSPAGDSFVAIRMGCASSCAADFDGSGSIGGADLAMALGLWGEATEADLNGDGVVDSIDIGLLLDAWGPCSSR